MTLHGCSAIDDKKSVAIQVGGSQSDHDNSPAQNTEIYEKSDEPKDWGESVSETSCSFLNGSQWSDSLRKKWAMYYIHLYTS